MDDFFELYKVLPKYVKYLRDESIGGDSRLYKEDKEARPYFGITLRNGQRYCVPITKYKKRFHYLTNKKPDFIPIFKNGKMVAGIELNKMIPVPENQIRVLDINITKKDIKNGYDDDKRLRSYERNWCMTHREQIQAKAQLLYDSYISNNISDTNIPACANFPQLETICNQYAQSHPSQNQSPRSSKRNSRIQKYNSKKIKRKSSIFIL